MLVLLQRTELENKIKTQACNKFHYKPILYKGKMTMKIQNLAVIFIIIILPISIILGVYTRKSNENIKFTNQL